MAKRDLNWICANRRRNMFFSCYDCICRDCPKDCKDCEENGITPDSEQCLFLGMWRMYEREDPNDYRTNLVATRRKLTRLEEVRHLSAEQMATLLENPPSDEELCKGKLVYEDGQMKCPNNTQCHQCLVEWLLGTDEELQE